ncbi:MAG: helix-turn-helix domain-containing protein, partial [Proteobacteria bacterium]|nr:helix-turn-helix domain-containing protein [Pseudomonadota bacterium]
FDAVSKHKSRTLSMDVFKAYINKCSVGYEILPASQPVETVFAVVDRLPTLKESGRLLVQEALNRAQGNQAIAAQMLGVTRQALNWRLKQEG